MFDTHDRMTGAGARAIAIATALGLGWGCGHDWDKFVQPEGDASVGGSGPEAGVGGAAGTDGSAGGAGTGGSAGAGGAAGSGGTAGSAGAAGAGGTAGEGGSSGSAGAAGQGGGTLCTPNFSESCYDGPSGTQANAPCKAGLHVCTQDGMSWGDCLAQVLPTLEECGTADDEDCNGDANDFCADWTKCFGSPDGQSPEALAVDAQGRTVIAGIIEDDLDFGGGPLLVPGTSDVFVASFDASGKHLWSKVYGDTNSGTTWQSAFAVAIGGTGAAFVTGAFYGTMAFGSATVTSAGDGDIFLTRLNTDGSVVWAKRWGGTAWEEGTTVTADAAGNSWIGGGYCGAVDFGAGSGLDTPWGCNGYVLAVDAAGSAQWEFTFGESGDDWVASVRVDASGNLIIGGQVVSSADFGGTILTSKGQEDALIAKMTVDGDHVWAKSFGSTASDFVDAVATDAANNVFAAGFYGGGIDFGCGVIPHLGPTDLFVVKLSSSGNCLWGKGYGNPTGGSERARMASDAVGNVYVSMQFKGSSDFDGETVTSAGDHDVLLLALDSAGKRRYVRRFGDSDDQDGRGVGVDSSGRVYLTAEVGGTIDFGNGLYTANSSNDICLSRLSP
jgi:hypothetical protein